MKNAPATPPEPVLSEENACRVMQRAEALIAFVSKECFKGDGRLRLVAENLSNAIAHASSQMPVALNAPEEEIQLQCLKDPDVQTLALELEQRIATERGRIAKRCNLAHYFGNN